MRCFFLMFVLILCVMVAPIMAQAADQARFETDPTAPIEINADRLDVYRNEGQAIFAGNVIATQGPMKMTSHKTTLHTGEQGNQLKTIRAEGEVNLISENGSRATGDWAEHNVEAEKLIIGGKVVTLIEKGNKLRGAQLLVDMVTGKALLTGTDTKTDGTGRVRGLLTPGNTDNTEE